MINLNDFPPGLKSFLDYEKKRYLSATSNRRLKTCFGTTVGNPYPDLDTNLDITVKTFKPVNLIAIWLSMSECKIFNTKAPQSSLLRRKTDKGTELLFLIHPDSKHLYTELIERFSDMFFEQPALTLSGSRTFLISIQMKKGIQYVMVKLSLDQKLGGVNRVITLKKAKLAIANSALLQGKKIDQMAFMYEQCAVFPKGSESGMIIRQIPNFMLDPSSNYTAVPFYSLLGRENDILKKLVSNSDRTVTEFLKECILYPYITFFLDGLFSHHLSVEAHAQNLLLIVNLDTYSVHSKTPFLYRDMEGVNIFLTPEKIAQLPQDLKSKGHFYFDTHVQDTSNAFEHFFVGNVLFNLTKQLVTDSFFLKNDAQFLDWYTKMKDQNRLVNWTLGNDLFTHKEDLVFDEFENYGYVETLCSQIFIELLLTRRYSFDETSIIYQFRDSFHGKSDWWFKRLIGSIYSPFIKMLSFSVPSQNINIQQLN